MTPTNQLARRTLAALGVLALTLSVNDADASGFLNARFGADHGTPVGANPFSIYFNPAAITGAKGTQLVLENTFAYRIASYDRSASALSPSSAQNRDNPTYVEANTGKATIGNFLALPFIGLTSSDLAPNLTVGVASYVPFGGIANWGKNDAFKSGAGANRAPGAYDGQVRWHSISGSIITLYNTLAVAYKIPSAGLSFGINGSLVYHRLETIRARNINGSDDVVTDSGGALEGRSYLEASGVNASLAAGVMWEPNRDVRVGLSYTSRPSFGQMRLKGKLDVVLPNVTSNYDVDVTQTYPDVIRLGGAYNVTPEIELRADVEYVRWSAFQRQCVLNRDKSGPDGSQVDCSLYDNGASAYADDLAIIQVIPRKWRDAGSLRVGVGYALDEETELFGSVTGDTAASPDSTADATFIDSFKLIGTLGARHFFTKGFALAGSYNHVYFFERTVSGSTLYSGSSPPRPTDSPSANGTYNQQILFLNVNGAFYF